MITKQITKELKEAEAAPIRKRIDDRAEQVLARTRGHFVVDLLPPFCIPRYHIESPAYIVVLSDSHQIILANQSEQFDLELVPFEVFKGRMRKTLEKCKDFNCAPVEFHAQECAGWIANRGELFGGFLLPEYFMANKGLLDRAIGGIG